MDAKSIAIALILGLLYGVLNALTLEWRLPGAALAVSIRPQVVLPILSGFVLGPLPGFVTGCAGNVVGDCLSGWGLTYWPFSLANGFIGFLPGLLRIRGIDRIDTVKRFAGLLLTIAAGNLVGVGMGLFGYNRLCGDSFQQLTWQFFQPIIVSNIVLGVMLTPPLLMAMRRMPLTFEIRLSGAIFYVVSGLVLALLFALDTVGHRVLAGRLSGSMPADEVQALLEAVALADARIAGSLGLAAILAGGAVALLLLRRVSRPVAILAQAARYLRAGQFDRIDLTDIRDKDDELGRLAQVFDAAARQVREREESLQKTIQSLTVEINRTQETRELQEITETDYFRALRQRATDLRERKRAQGEPA